MDSLRSNFPKFLHAIKPDQCKKLFNSAIRYMSAYHGVNGVSLDAEQARYAHELYHSHRQVSEAVFAQVDKKCMYML